MVSKPFSYTLFSLTERKHNVAMSLTLTFSRLKQQNRQFSSKDQSDTSSGSQSGSEREVESKGLNPD